MKENLTVEQQATNYETSKHIRLVQALLNKFARALIQRGEVHDESKLHSPEVEMFTEFTAKLAGCTYGSDEYKQYLKDMGPALQHHYENNSHHPEFYRWHCPICDLAISQAQLEDAPQGPNNSGTRHCPRCCRNGIIYESALMLKTGFGINGMNLLDIVEMLCDWKAASTRHHDGSLTRSIEQNTDRFSLSPQLARIFRNTVQFLESDK